MAVVWPVDQPRLAHVGEELRLVWVVLDGGPHAEAPGHGRLRAENGVVDLVEPHAVRIEPGDGDLGEVRRPGGDADDVPPCRPQCEDAELGTVGGLGFDVEARVAERLVEERVEGALRNAEVEQA